MDFMKDFLHKDAGRPKADAKGYRHTVHNDRWDQEDWNACLREMKDVSVADDALRKVTPTGHEAMGDTFYALVKASPEQRKTSEIRPSYAVNHAVIGQAMELTEYQELRTYSVGDEVATGLAVVSMEPELEILFDKLKDEQKLAQQIEQMLQEQQQLEDESDDIEKMLSDMEDQSCPEAVNMQEQQDRIQEQIDRLQQQIDQAGQQLSDQLQLQGPQIRSHMQEALKEAVEQAESMDNLSLSWGLEPGALTRMPAQKRIELAKRVNTEKFRKLAELIGPMQRLAMSEQQRKTIFSKDEVYDIEFGNDLSHILPVELLGLAYDEYDDEELAELLELYELDFYNRYMNERLLQFKLQGVEKVAKGGIIFCEDGSGSMSGNNEIWAKAVGLALLHIARMQKREFYGIHFGSAYEIATFDFDLKAGTVERQIKSREPETLPYLDGVIEFAEYFWNGGTDFMTPLSHALDKLRKQHEEHGAIKGDIVFVTDGLCGVSQQWLDDFKEEQTRLDFKVYGILIGHYSPDSEPLKTICDDRVFTIQELMSGKEIADVFRGI